MKTLNLKFRFAIWMSIGALSLLVGTDVLGLYFAQKDVLDRLRDQQLGSVSSAADELDAKLKLATDSLSIAAGAATPEVIASRENFRKFYAERTTLLKFFDDLVLLDAHGIVTANYPGELSLVGEDLHDRATFRSVMADGLPSISGPLVGKLSKRPLIVIGAPIVDAAHQVTGALFGSIRLDKPNFLGSLSSARLGKLGYFTVTTRSPVPVYLVHPDVGLLLKPVLPDQNPAMRAIVDATDGGAAESTLADGSAVLIAYRPLSITPWVLASILPRRDAVALIDRAQTRTTFIALVVATLLLPLTWWFAGRLLAPLSVLRAEVDALTNDPASQARVHEVRDDEVGEVARAFNALLVRQRRSDDLRAASDRDRRRLVGILESSRDLIATTDPDGHITYMNESARRTHGIAPDDDLKEKTRRDFFPHWVVERLEKEALPIALAEGIWLGETVVYDKDRVEIPVDHMLIAHRNPDGEVEFFSTILHDISAAKAAHAAARQSEARMLSVADALPVMVAFIDRDHRYAFVNSRYEELFRLPRAQIVGQTIAELAGGEAFMVYGPYLERASRGETVVFERDRIEGKRRFQFLVKLIPQYDVDSVLIGFHAIHEDVTDHKTEQQRLSRLASIDPLTGLLNRAGFEAALHESMQKSEAYLAPMALFYLDIDGFKRVNDERGHLVGDALLRAFAGRLTTAVRAADVVARLGGDEFVVIAEGLRSADAVRAVADKVLRAMRVAFEVNRLPLSITVSIGVGIYNGEPIKADELIERADSALYRAKKAGRDRYELSASVLALEASDGRLLPRIDGLIY